MASASSAPPQYTAYKQEPQQLSAPGVPSADLSQDAKPHTDTNGSSIAFAKAAFQFRGALDRKKLGTVPAPVKPVDEAIDQAPSEEELANKAHQLRHKRRVRVARAIQHLLTSLLSIGVASLQGQTYITYERTKNVANAWPQVPNLLPTLMLFITSIMALFIDICAITAYLLPQSKIGHEAYSLAVSAHWIITTFKGVAYSFSTVVCRAGFVQGNATNQNNDLWSWSCSMKASPMQHVNKCNSLCTGSTVAWIFAIINVAIEVLGIVIDKFVKRGGQGSKSGGTDASTEVEAAKATSNTNADTKPLLANAQPLTGSGFGNKGKYQKLTDDEYDSLENLSGDLNKQLTDSLPNMSVQK